MREYKKPEIQIVSLKSSEDIALTYDAIKDGLVQNYLTAGGNKYAITRYTVNNSVLSNRKNTETPAES